MGPRHQGRTAPPGTPVDSCWTAHPFRPHGRITAGNAAGLTDGATACLLAASEVAVELGLPSRMRLVGYGFAGVDPEVMGAEPDPVHGEGAAGNRTDH